MHLSPIGGLGCCPFYGGGTVVVELIMLTLWGFCVCSLFCYAILCVLSSFAIIWLPYFIFVFLMPCDFYCSVALPHGAAS